MNLKVMMKKDENFITKFNKEKNKYKEIGPSQLEDLLILVKFKLIKFNITTNLLLI